MSGPERNSYFCFPASPGVSRDEVGITLKIVALSLRLRACLGVFIHEKENWRCFIPPSVTSLSTMLRSRAIMYPEQGALLNVSRSGYL